MTKSGIPGYKILKSIGKGGTSKVFLAIQMSVGRTIAIKVLSDDFSKDIKFSNQFLKEANCGVLNHPNIITIHDAGEGNGHLYIAMEYLLGGDLKQKMLQGLNENQVIKIIAQVAQALSHAHSNHFTHRDIKPSNILFDEHDNAILADFGIAKTVRFSPDASLSDGGFIGTPNYISPEQVSDQPIDHRADLYSLGVVYYEILTGEKPFVADSTYTLIFKHLKEEVPPLEQKYERHQHIISKLLEKEPAKRYQSADMLLRDLGQLSIDEPIKRPPKTTLRNGSVLVALLIALSSVLYTQLNPKEKIVRESKPIITHASSDIKTIEKLEEDIKKSIAENQLLQNKNSVFNAISSHLTNASMYLSLEQLVSPDEKNALHEFRQVLKLEPENTQALYGISNIIQHYQLMANNEKDKGNYSRSIEFINMGLVVDSNRAELLSAKEAVDQLLKQQGTDKKIKSGLRRANRLIKNDKLNDARLELNELNRLYSNNKKIQAKLAQINKDIKRQKFISNELKSSADLLNNSPIFEPYISQACENSYSLLQLEPNNKEIKVIIESCARQYLLLAKQAASTESAIELVETGLNYSPNDPGLSQLLQLLLTSEPTLKADKN